MTLRRVQLMVIFFSIWMLAVFLPTVRFAPGNWAFLQMEGIREDISPGMQILLEIIGIGLIIGLITLGILIVLFI